MIESLYRTTVRTSYGVNTVNLVVFIWSILCMTISLVEGASKGVWKDKVVYQILTDRFDTVPTTTEPCDDLTNYCGGAFKGIYNRLDYLKDLGIDAILISPVITNTEKGYHGYWAKNLYTINEHFGTEEELAELINGAHDLGLLVMVDVVTNHMGQGMEDVPELIPFNDTAYYHDCGCVDGDCCPESCWVEDYTNELQMLHCQLFGLPDLNHDLDYVATELVNWISALIKNWKFDGVRLDTVPYVRSDFWRKFTSASGVFSLGEVSTAEISEVAKYVTNGSMDSAFEYPLYLTAIDVFAHMHSMNALSEKIEEARETLGIDDVQYLGTFAENHDQPRFLAQRDDIMADRNMILFSIATEGIPFIFYGQEQGYHGGLKFEENREPLWTSGFPTTDSYMGFYSYIQTILRYRKISKFYEMPNTEIWVEENMYVFSRKDVLFALTNVGIDGRTLTKTVSGFGVPYQKGVTVCNIFYPEDDCLTLVEDYTIDIILVGGECKVFVPQDMILS